MRILLIALSLVGGTDLEWQTTLVEIGRIKDKAKALERIAPLEKALGEVGTPEANARLGELLVRAKLPRLGMMAQGMEAMRAIGLFEGILKVQPENAQVLTLHARTCLAMPAMFGKRETGIQSLQKLVDLADRQPGAVASPDVFLLLAKLKPDSAGKTLRIGLRSFPDEKRMQAAAKKSCAVSAAVERGEAEGSKERFLNALMANKLEYATLDRDLAAGQAAHPDDHEFPMYRGLLRLWQLESVASARVASEAIDLFRKALALNPEDTRIYGWLGPLLYVAGHASGQKPMVADGERVMAEGIQKNPEQNLFGRALAYRMTGTNVKQIEADLYRTFELCTGAKMDRTRFQPVAGTTDHPASRDTKYTPFNRAGTFYWAGEYFASIGAKRRARDAYVGALRVDARKKWPYRELAVERLEVLDGKRVAVTKNPASCMLCHQK